MTIKEELAMTTMEFIITNNLMAGVTLRAIEERIPCFCHLSDADFNNLETTIAVTIQCREEDVNFVKEQLAPFV